MKFDIDKNDNYVLLKFGESKLNALNSSPLKSDLAILNAEGHKNIIADLSQVKFIDSSGLSALLTGHGLCKDAGGSFIITGLNDSVARLISVAQLDSVFSMTPAVDAAIGRLAV